MICPGPSEQVSRASLQCGVRSQRNGGLGEEEHSQTIRLTVNFKLVLKFVQHRSVPCTSRNERILSLGAYAIDDLYQIPHIIIIAH